MQSNEPQKMVVGRSIGAILIDRGRLSAVDAEKILRMQKEQNIRFGDAGLALGLLTQEDIQSALAYQFDYPYLKRGDPSVSEEVSAAFNSTSKLIEQVRALRTQLMLRWFDTDPQHKCISVVSLARGDGRSFIAANLAVVFSQLGERTLLIDADMRHPRIHELFKVPNTGGLSAVLSSRLQPSEAVYRISKLLGLSVLPAGATPPNPQELLSRDTFQSMLAEYSEKYDVIIIDTPAATDCADAHTISFRVGAAFFVANNNRTPAIEFDHLATLLRDSNVNIIGVTLNDRAI